MDGRPARAGDYADTPAALIQINAMCSRASRTRLKTFTPKCIAIVFLTGMAGGGRDGLAARAPHDEAERGLHCF
eukprot:81244-Pyramimonas_sp.AAC.1